MKVWEHGHLEMPHLSLDVLQTLRTTVILRACDLSFAQKWMAVAAERRPALGNCSLSATTLSYLSSRPKRSVGEGSAVRHSVDPHFLFAATLSFVILRARNFFDRFMFFYTQP